MLSYTLVVKILFGVILAVSKLGTEHGPSMSNTFNQRFAAIRREMSPLLTGTLIRKLIDMAPGRLTAIEHGAKATKAELEDLSMVFNIDLVSIARAYGAIHKPRQQRLNVTSLLPMLTETYSAKSP